jgi:hypothetical protein
MTRKEEAITKLTELLENGEGVVDGEACLRHLANFFSGSQLEEFVEFVKDEYTP